MHGFPRGKTAVVGAATFGVGRSPGFEAIDLAAHASLLALADAGVTPADVDALFIAQPQDTLATLSFSEYLGIRPRLTDNNRSGGSAFLLHLEHAALALDAGLCDVALIAYAYLPVGSDSVSSDYVDPLARFAWAVSFSDRLALSGTVEVAAEREDDRHVARSRR